MPVRVFSRDLVEPQCDDVLLIREVHRTYRGHVLKVDHLTLNDLVKVLVDRGLLVLADG